MRRRESATRRRAADERAFRITFFAVRATCFLGNNAVFL
ncbi:hypothetical protein BRO54_0928 [Geobacillus proteiniphilus]|uniref:Uncharacterized protein n=1 Tax=Geobacillus proteiniphilus TaxID=860353 RepID=A0A1Q5T5I2_9BACL|nr:hypothetical protein BRO54_0928 [Geobacillus proteiniphilus]